MNIIKDKRTLKAMAKQGHIIFPAKFGGNSCQVDHKNLLHMRFEYKNEKYHIQYFEGSIYPFVAKLD